MSRLSMLLSLTLNCLQHIARFPPYIYVTLGKLSSILLTSWFTLDPLPTRLDPSCSSLRITMQHFVKFLSNCWYGTICVHVMLSVGLSVSLVLTLLLYRRHPVCLKWCMLGRKYARFIYVVPSEVCVITHSDLRVHIYGHEHDPIDYVEYICMEDEGNSCGSLCKYSLVNN